MLTKQVLVVRHFHCWTALSGGSPSSVTVACAATKSGKCIHLTLVLLEAAQRVCMRRCSKVPDLDAAITARRCKDVLVLLSRAGAVAVSPGASSSPRFIALTTDQEDGLVCQVQLCH